MEWSTAFSRSVLTERVLAGRYRLFELLGEGGMALVYRAHDDLLERDVAVKVLRAGFAADPEFVSRFRQEARSAASLHHPNIATVYDTGTDEGADFIVMQLVDGEDLERMLERVGRLPLNLALRIGVDVARALQAAHERGIVHRDVKPANILVDRDGNVRVVDFGIARAADAAVGITTAGVILGSAQYVSPEQVAGGKIAPASDIYSLGVVMYESITGQRPFDGPSPAAVALERLHVRPAPPSAVAHDLPPGVDPLILRALERDPGARYSSAGDFAAALESWRLGLLGGVRRSGAGPRDAAGGGVVAVAAGAIGGAATATMGRGGGGAFPPIPTGRVGRRGGPPTGATARPTARDRERRRRFPPALLVPIAALGLLAIATLAFLTSMGRGAGGVAGETGTPRPSAVAVIPPPSPEQTIEPTPTAIPSPSPSPSPTPSPTPTPTPKPTPTPEPTPTRQPEPTPEPTPTRRPAETSPPAPAGPARDPAETVARFYRLVVEERFDEAAALWTAEMRERYPPAGNIDGRFAPTTDIELVRNEIVAMDVAAGTANVAVDLIEYRESGPSPRRFVGDWDLVLVDGRWLMSDPDF